MHAILALQVAQQEKPINNAILQASCSKTEVEFSLLL